MEDKTLGVEKISGVLRAVTGSPHPKNFTSAIIAAAGMSSRFGGETTKQMTKICGKPLLLHTLMAYQEADCIHEIILVAKKEEIPQWEKLCRALCLPKLSKIVEGGETRQISVLNGLDEVSKKSRFVAIADGARCLTTPEQINDVCRAAYKHKAATAAHRSTDTVKISDKRGFTESTPDRDTVYLVQTPQVFNTNLYRAAAYTAHKEGFSATDDTSLCEHIGQTVKLVECGSGNIKVTTREDLVYAEAILKKRKMGGEVNL